MRKLMILVLALVLLGASTAATAATMSCSLDGVDFTPKYCFGMLPGAHYAKAVFRVDPPLPENFEVRWRKVLKGNEYDVPCNAYSSVCTLSIQAFVPLTVIALVLEQDNHTWFEVSATAFLENGQ